MEKRKRRKFNLELRLTIIKEGFQNIFPVNEIGKLYEIYPVDYFRWK